MSTFSQDRIHSPVIGQPIDATRRKQPPQQPRQLLSCTKCRERKVKCDRTKPCSACCARGVPKECHFVAEGGDYAPIQQSYELRKLRAENLRLKERLRNSRISIEDDNSDESSGSQPGDRSRASSMKRRAARQKRFQGSEWSDSIYFGSPGLATVIADFATVNLTPTNAQSLAHLMPGGRDMCTPKSPSSYPFATLFTATPEECIPQLLDILPTRKELMDYLVAFEKRVYVCAFPHLPIELTKTEIERFLTDPERNARMCPDMLALVFAAIALGAQHSVWDKSGKQWRAQSVDAEAQRGNVYVAAAMQALRISSFMHKPSLLAIEALIMIGPFLANSGRFLDAWTLFGTTIRLAQAIGLHRHPKYLNPASPTQRECSVRQTIWWWMLHMDEQYSMTLGRPLGISGMGDCPPPHELTTDPHVLRFSEFINHFTILARQILSSDRLTNAKIDEFTDLMTGLLDTMPEMLQFDHTWLDDDKELPEWPLSAMAAVYYCKTHTYLILLNRQRTEKHTDYSQIPTAKLSSSFRPVNRTPASQPSPTASTKASHRGRPLVLTSCEGILTAFLFFYTRAPAALVTWTISQQAFNSSMILLLDALETGNLTHIRKVEQAYVVFRELQDNGVHRLADLAVEKLSWGLDQLRKNMGVFGTHRSPNNAFEAEQPIRSQAGRTADPIHDTVMGNTGMLLLEESGLQSITPERFAPFTWATTKAGSKDTTPNQLKQEQELQLGGFQLEDMNNIGSISSELHGNRESPQRPALGQYCALQSQEHVPPRGGVMGVASPRSLVVPVPQQNHHDGTNVTRHRHSRQNQLPHLQRLESRRISPTMAFENNRGLDRSKEDDYSISPQEPWAQPVLSPKQCQPSATQLRHNSCPSLHHSAMTPPLLRPTYSSPIADKVHSFVSEEHYGVQTQWSANPAGLILDGPGPGMLTSPMSDHGHVIPVFHHGSAQQQQVFHQYPFAPRSTAASANSTAAIVEQMKVDEWKRWIGNEGLR